MVCGSLKQETAVVSMMFILLPQIWQTSLCKPLSREHGTHMVGWCQLLRKGSQFPSVFTETLGKSWLQSSGRCWHLLLRRRERIQILPGWGPATALECSKSSRHCPSSHWSRMWNISRLWLFKKSVSPDALIFSNFISEKNSLLSLSTSVTKIHSNFPLPMSLRFSCIWKMEGRNCSVHSPAG